MTIIIARSMSTRDWSVKYEQDGPVQPRFEINAPDLYIPTMAYVTYLLVAGLVLGMQERFNPEQIGILASSALAWCIVELAVYSCTLYITQVETSLRTLDLLAYAGYKFVGTIKVTFKIIAIMEHNNPWQAIRDDYIFFSF
ncbi:hypothetical protein NQ317_009531 [Molorchus minor]|uniref:Protein YIF1 n=1 Tax=Molorchus minor TaxID=1323400 RepID=A0ABQ9IUP3_9CUCU|nr:hypothetical protein NQ317_009531 [Molorchus minor]